MKNFSHSLFISELNLLLEGVHSETHLQEEREQAWEGAMSENPTDNSGGAATVKLSFGQFVSSAAR